MKKLQVLTSLLFLSICVLIFSCNKDSSLITEKELLSEREAMPENLIAEAKDWHRLQSNAPGFFSISKQKSFILPPIWEKATYEKLSNGTKVLVVPSWEVRLNNKNFACLRKLIFSVQDGKITDGKIVEIIGTPNYISAHKESLITKYTDSRIENFSGAVIVYDVKYKFISGSEYKNGNKINSRARIMRAIPGTSIPGNSKKKQVSPPRISTECYDYYLVTYYPDGSQSWEYLYTSCYGDDGDGEGVGGGEPGGGEPGSDPGSDPVITEMVAASGPDVILDEEDYEAVFTASIDEPSGPTAPVPLRIKPTYFEVKRYQNSGIIISVTQHPLAPDPVYAYYTDKYGRPATRYVTLLNQSYHYVQTSPWSVTLFWSCLINKRYTWSTGESVTRQSNYSFSATYN